MLLIIKRKSFKNFNL